MFAVCCFILFKIDYSTLYFTLQRYLKKSKSHIIFWISILIYVKIILFDLILAKIDKYRLVIRYILGTTVQLCLSFFLNLNYIASLFHILGRNAQYFWMVNESFSVESWSLQDEVQYIWPIFHFFDSPFSSKGKRRKRG